jgi:hypothetical protein
MREITVPDACTLTPPELGERLSWIRQEILPHALCREALEGGAAWRFAPDPGVREKLERLVVLESDCCSSDAIRFSLHQEPEALRLEVHGIDPDETLLGPRPAGAGSGIRRIAQAGGVGTLGALLLCCVLPIGIASVAGAAVAAPLAGLDHPLPIAAAALLLGTATWWSLRRRAARQDC